jgi:hypothetical protein
MEAAKEELVNEVVQKILEVCVQSWCTAEANQEAD